MVGAVWETLWLMHKDKEGNQEGEKNRRAAQFDRCLNSLLRILAHGLFPDSYMYIPFSLYYQNIGTLFSRGTTEASKWHK